MLLSRVADWQADSQTQEPPAALPQSQDSLGFLVQPTLHDARWLSLMAFSEKNLASVLDASHLVETATVVTESANSFMVWMASKERERMSHTLTAWS